MGISQQTAAMIGAEWERRTRRQWKGCEPYIAIRPLREELKLQATTEAMRNGRVAVTAKKYGVSRSTLHRWIRVARTSSRNELPTLGESKRGRPNSKEMLYRIINVKRGD